MPRSAQLAAAVGARFEAQAQPVEHDTIDLDLAAEQRQQPDAGLYRVHNWQKAAPKTRRIAQPGPRPPRSRAKGILKADVAFDLELATGALTHHPANVSR